jgi:hypothetical protein
MTESLHLSRAQLAIFLKDPQAIKQFEGLFAIANQVPPTTQEAGDTTVTADSAMATAQQALGALERIANALEMLALAPSYIPSTVEADIVPPVVVGSLGHQSADNVTISGGAITAALTGNQTTLLATSVALANGAAAAIGTLTNTPTAGNPTKWVAIDDNGTTRYIPTW